MALSVGQLRRRVPKVLFEDTVPSRSVDHVKLSWRFPRPGAQREGRGRMTSIGPVWHAVISVLARLNLQIYELDRLSDNAVPVDPATSTRCRDRACTGRWVHHPRTKGCLTGA
jgi:hypothetical protein